MISLKSIKFIGSISNVGESFMSELNLKKILDNPNYRVLMKLEEKLEKRASLSSRKFTAMIIDIETMGLDPKKDGIIEIGILQISCDEMGIIEVMETYNCFQDPLMPIPEKITKLTGITNDDVVGKEIDWQHITLLLKNTDLVICHNSGFDRNFLEHQTPVHVQELFKQMRFGCTMKDIDWEERGYGSYKLDYLNWKLGYFYEAHRALTDCWATLNLLLKEPGAFDELKDNVKKPQMLLCAVGAPIERKDLLKERKYRWSDGNGSSRLPKCWWTIVPNDDIQNEMEFLDETIFCYPGAAANLPRCKITARTKYSFRAEVLGN